MIDHRSLALGAAALALALGPISAHAEGPGGNAPSHAKPDGKPGHPDKPGRERRHDGDGEVRLGGPAPSGAPSGRFPGALRPRRSDDFRNAMRDLHEQLKAGTLKKEELKERLAQLRETAEARGKEHRRELGRRWGGALAQPSAKEELKNHARRMAMLNRAQVLAETSGRADQAKLTERIAKLIAKENERHERAMARLQAAAPTGSAVPAASAAPPASSADASGGKP